MKNEFKLITDHSSDMIYKMNLSDRSYGYGLPAEKITGYHRMILLFKETP